MKREQIFQYLSSDKQACHSPRTHYLNTESTRL